jgi:hypothetical protein
MAQSAEISLCLKFGTKQFDQIDVWRQRPGWKDSLADPAEPNSILNQLRHASGEISVPDSLAIAPNSRPAMMLNGDGTMARRCWTAPYLSCFASFGWWRWNLKSGAFA